MKQRTKAHFALLLSNLLFGINYSAVQYITKKLVLPFGLNLVRAGSTSLFLWLIYPLFPGTRRIQRKDISRLFLCAITGIVINQLLFIKGLSMTFSIHASLLVLVTPILITLFAALLGKEQMTFFSLAGLGLGIGGAMLLILKGENKGLAGNVFWGDIFIIINAISYAFYFVLVKPLMQKYNPVQVLRWIFTIGTLFIALFGWKEFSAINWPQFSAFDFSVLLYIVLGATFFAYLFTIYGISKLGASITGAYIYTQPVFASVMAVLFLGEYLAWYKIGAAILIMTGVYLVNRKK